jgi:hypothetical protein
MNTRLCVSIRGFVFHRAETGHVGLFLRGSAGRCGADGGALSDQGIDTRLCVYEYAVVCVLIWGCLRIECVRSRYEYAFVGLNI